MRRRRKPVDILDGLKDIDVLIQGGEFHLGELFWGDLLHQHAQHNPILKGGQEIWFQRSQPEQFRNPAKGEGEGKKKQGESKRK